MQDSLPAGGLRLYREGVEPSGSLRKVSGYIAFLLSRISPDARVVYAKPPFAGPEQVLDYVGRYTHRVAISNNRILDIDGGKVRFRWKDYRRRGQQKTMTVSAEEFIRRFLIHVPPSNFQRIRYYGFLGNRYRAEKLAQCRRLLAMAEPQPVVASEEKDYRDRYEELTGVSLCQCPVCNLGRMMPFRTLPPITSAPPSVDTS